MKFRPCFFLVALLLQLVLAAAASAQQDTVRFKCDGPSGSTCYFSIRYINNNGNRNFTLRAGESDRISGVAINRDRYCVCVDTQCPNTLSECVNGYRGKFCRTDTVRANNN
jgi:hypothetical protein